MLTITPWAALDAAGRRQLLARPALTADAERRAQVERILEQVRADGDATLRALTRRFDGAELGELSVSEAEFAAAEASLPASLKAAIQRSWNRIRRYHEATKPQPLAWQGGPGLVLERAVLPIQRVGLYVPAGSAPLPSTALMLGVPAQIAGCPEVVLCTPPKPDGSADPAVLYAARLCGISRVVKIGGAQAIAAMAYGTETVPRCDKLYGPGNSWVMQAKTLVSAEPGGPAIDLPAGPSEVLVVADASADAGVVAADLLSQAEHGPDSQVLCVSPDRAVLEAVAAEVERQAALLPRAETVAVALTHARLVLTADLAEALEVANQYASEHLILNIAEPRQWLGCVRAAGSIFLGPYAPETLGDYNSGGNHCLPTYGHARAWSGLSVLSFVKLVTVQEVGREALLEIGPDAVEIARAEGLEAHARAVTLRLERIAGASA
jgi:histidinol dehydrogenase